MCDWQVAALLDDIASHAAHAPSTVSQLFAAPAGLPSESQRETLDQCVALARQNGLTLPECRIVWKAAPADVCPGGLRVDADGSYTLALSITRADLHAFAMSALHELMHLSDWHAGVPFDREAYERRAVKFSRDMVGQLW